MLKAGHVRRTDRHDQDTPAATGRNPGIKRKSPLRRQVRVPCTGSQRCPVPRAQGGN